MTHLLVGNMTNNPDIAGVYSCEVDEESAKGKIVNFVSQPNPSHLAYSRRHGIAYVASHIPVTDDEPGGSIVSYRVDPPTGTFSKLNRQILPMTHPAFVELDRNENFLFFACTAGGGVGVLSIAQDGRLGPPVAIQFHPGSPQVPLGARERPSSKPTDACQPHSIGADPTNRLVIAPDLVLQQVICSRFDADGGSLTRVESELRFPANTGPRHFVFHPSNGMLYVLNETEPSITVLTYDATSCSLVHLGSVRTLPSDYVGPNKGAEIVLSPDGQHLYCSNRGHDSITNFDVWGKAPYLTFGTSHPSGGCSPRGLAFSPSGRHLFVANRDSDLISSFRVDASSGTLELTSQEIGVPKPNCVVFT